MKKYIAILKSTNNKMSIIFESKHRANSKENFNDCRKLLQNTYGYDFLYNYTIEHTALFN